MPHLDLKSLDLALIISTIAKSNICNHMFVVQNKMHKWLQDYPNPTSELKPTTHNQQILEKEIQHNMGTPETRAKI